MSSADERRCGKFFLKNRGSPVTAQEESLEAAGALEPGAGSSAQGARGGAARGSSERTRGPARPPELEQHVRRQCALSLVLSSDLHKERLKACS